MQDTARSALLKLSEGNPGALRVLCDLLRREDGTMLLLHADDMGLRGSSVWLGFKDFAKENYDTFAKALVERDPEMVRVINAAGGNAWTGGKS